MISMPIGEFGKNAKAGEEALINFFEEKKIKISYPMAIKVISVSLGVREETARKYLDYILLNSHQIKTNYWELWFDTQP